MKMPKASSRTSSESSVEFSSMCRQQRNFAEKQRRDKLNSYISELATIVPFVSHAAKRLDKTSILRLAAAHIRMHKNVVTGRQNLKVASWRPDFVNIDNVKELLENVEGFLFISSSTGKIIYMSSSVERFLGHQNIDMMGHSLLSFIHPADVDIVQTNFLSLSEAIDKGNDTARCSFHCRIREKSQPRSEVVSYQMFYIRGQMAFDRVNEECNSDESRSSNSLLKGFVQLVHSSPFSQILSSSICDEYITYHDTLGRITHVDQNISTITGYLPQEVFMKSAYDYILPEDGIVAAFAQKLMFSSSNGRGLIVYRLRTVTDASIYLMSSGFLQFDAKSGQIKNFICINRLLSEDVGSKELVKFKERYSPHTEEELSPNTSAPSSPQITAPVMEDGELSPASTYLDSVPSQPSFVPVASPGSTGRSVSSDLFADTNDCSALDDMEAFDFDTMTAQLVQSEQLSGHPKDNSECSELSGISSCFPAVSEEDWLGESFYLDHEDVLKRTVCTDHLKPSLQFVPGSSLPFH